ncbi:unnamed protein product [Chrysoparadoxa australica]
MAGMGFFKGVELPVPDALFGLKAEFERDGAEERVDTLVGAYRDGNGKPWPLPVVREVEKLMASDGTLHHEYLPIQGSAEFRKQVQRLMFGDDHSLLQSGLVATIQAVGGTGAIRVGVQLLLEMMGQDLIVYHPEQTWINHPQVLKAAGVPASNIRTYRYYDTKRNQLCWDGMIEDIRGAPRGSVILLHMCAHNPTGLDPSPAQWGELATLILEKGLLPFFDNAYQGFATGDLVRDAASVHMFLDRGMQMLIACSFSKNMGLYGERVGALHVVTGSANEAKNVEGALKAIIRPMYSNPPSAGARVVTAILSDPTLKAAWVSELGGMPLRITKMRKMLHDALLKNGTAGDWSHIMRQTGMFCYTGLSRDCVERLRKDHHIYMAGSGRMSLCGLTEANIPLVAGAFKAVLGGGQSPPAAL